MNKGLDKMQIKVIDSSDSDKKSLTTSLVDKTQEAIELAFSYVKKDSYWNYIVADTDDYIVLFCSFYSQTKAKVLVISKHSGSLIHSFSGDIFYTGNPLRHNEIHSYKNILCIPSGNKIVLYDIDNNSISTVISNYKINGRDTWFNILCFNGKYIVVKTASASKSLLLDCKDKSITEIPYMHHRAIICDNYVIHDECFTLNRYNIDKEVDEVIFDCQKYFIPNAYVYNSASGSSKGYILIDDFGIDNTKIYLIMRTGYYKQPFTSATNLKKCSLYCMDYNLLKNIECIHEDIPIYDVTSSLCCDNYRNYINGFIWIGEDSEYTYHNAPNFNIYKFEYDEKKISKLASHSGCCHRYGLFNTIQEYSPKCDYIFFRKSLIYKQFYGDIDGPNLFDIEYNTFVDIEKSTSKYL